MYHIYNLSEKISKQKNLNKVEIILSYYKHKTLTSYVHSNVEENICKGINK